MLGLGMMLFSYAVTSLFKSAPGFRQPFADGSFGGLSTMFNGLTGGTCCMFHGFASLGRSFLYGFASFLHWTLIFRPHRKRCAQRQNNN
jgi:hypothetical protein